MMKWYQQNNKAAGNSWMVLGSRFAKVFNVFVSGVVPGAVVSLSRADYKVQSDGSLRRITGKPRNRKRPGIVLTERVAQ
jgi:hypothetical protein